ncbi:uncharacterized protein LOC135385475 [Ornithodoros turicata]|uniref:uncharacterized protein LOC135371547 n=1 Tax=Ornithodoros turicata TaxID=34597 RepID=UPI0031399E0A
MEELQRENSGGVASAQVGAAAVGPYAVHHYNGGHDTSCSIASTNVTSEARPPQSLRENESCGGVTSTASPPAARIRRKRYLEPNSPYVVPRQTLYHQRKKGCLQVSAETHNEQVMSSPESLSLAPEEETHNCNTVPNATGDEECPPAGPESDVGNVQPECHLEHNESDGSLHECNSDSSESSDTEADDAEACNMDDRDITNFLKEYSEVTLPNQTTTKAQALLLILMYAVTAGLSWTHVDGLLKLINALLGSKVLPNSNYMFRKIWKHAKKGTIELHYFCEDCDMHLGHSIHPISTGSVKCNSCRTKYDTTKLVARGKFFIIFDIKRQLQSVLKRFSRSILENIQQIRSRASSRFLSDITDGALYRNMRLQSWWEDTDVTVTFSTDGANVFKSRPASVWPLQLIINEMPLPARWHNIIIGGLWFSSHHPNMFMYLKVFIDKLRKLGTVMWEDASTSRQISSHVHVLACSVDAPARAMVLNRKQYNGYDGCPWCYHPGKYIDGSVRYPYREQLRMRTHNEVVRDMKKATNQGEVVNGIKGLSAVVQLEGFDVVRGISPDYMHCVLEGVTKQFTEFWLTKCTSEAYIGGKVNTVNERLSHIHPPIASTRLPRSIDERASWKATEWKFWLLFYCLPCVEGLLPQQFLYHFGLLSEAIFLLLKSTISPEELSRAERLIKQFVKQTEGLYNEAMSTYNVHQLLHLPDTVRNLGPLWATSMFPFESNNRVILRLVTAANSVPLQIAERCVMKQKLHDLAQFVHLSEGFNIFSRPSRCCSSVLGSEQTPLDISQTIQQLIQQRLGHLPELQRYLRAVVNGVTVHSAQHTRPTKTCSRFIKARQGSFCEVLVILKVKREEQILFVCRESIVDSVIAEASHIRRCELPPDGQDICVVADSDIECAAIFIDVGTSQFLSVPPNTLETN